MAIIINDNLAVNAGKPVDAKYLNITTPWVSTSHVNLNIPESYRYVGLAVNILNEEYWYQYGITDGDLVPKIAISDVTGATNGTRLTFNRKLVLGGTLTGNTVFDGGVSMYNLRYAGDYSSNYTNRSLVDKEYVDGIAAGLQPKAAVLVATTGETTLSGLITVDGVLLQAGDRVLVKNQINDVENGVYDASISDWSRSSDFDGSPLSEVVNGSYMWVLSGSTNKNTAWVLTTQSPIVGVSGLTFVLFSTVTDVLAGTGIIVTQSSGAHYVAFDGAGVAGTGLNWNGSQLNVTVSGANNITGATNGITKTSENIVVLGGALTGSTFIGVPYGSISSFKISDNTDNSLSGNWHGGRIELNRDNATVSNNTAFIGARHDIDCYSWLNATVSTGITLSAFYGGREHSVTLGYNGLVYDECYHSHYTDRSLVDKEYVDSAGSSVSASNGLTKTGLVIRLGGVLTGTTNISGGTQVLNIGTSGSLLNSLNTYSVASLTCTSGNINLNSGGGAGIISLSTNNSVCGIRLTAPTTGAIYNADYSAGFVNESLVTKRYVDNRNKVCIHIVTGTSYVAQLTDAFVGVTYTCNTISPTIYLPTVTSPTNDGQKIIISDMSGCALDNCNIIIDGQGKRINDASSTFSSINTNYGSVTFVFNGIFWSASAFVN